MPLPHLELGLIVQYGFVWYGTEHNSPPDAGKERPCVIVDIEEVEVIRGRRTTRVTYLPISHVSPRAGEHAFPIKNKIAKYLGLTAQESFLYTSYACEDDWPYDLAQLSRQPGRFHYGVLPPAFFSTVVEDFRARLLRQPGFMLRR